MSLMPSRIAAESFPLPVRPVSSKLPKELGFFEPSMKRGQSAKPARWSAGVIGRVLTAFGQNDAALAMKAIGREYPLQLQRHRGSVGILSRCRAQQMEQVQLALQRMPFLPPAFHGPVVRLSPLRDLPTTQLEQLLVDQS